MVAVVNKHVILESELDQALRVEYLMQGKSLDKISPTDSSAVLDRLVDRALLDQQILHPEMLAPTPKELADQVKEVAPTSSRRCLGFGLEIASCYL